VTAMSTRTAGASRAIKQAWENEQRLVLEGKGTRNWTEEQQKQIKEKGKAYDDKGMAFEGQHMKSVSAYPEYQDDPRNIQFLSREEHLAAHGGSWMNVTNGYFDPELRTMSDFGNGPPRACVEIVLTDALRADPLDSSSTQTSLSASKSGNSLADAAAAPTSDLRQQTQALRRFVRQASKDSRVRTAVVSLFAMAATDALNRASSAKGRRTAAPSTQPSTRTPSGPGTESPSGGRQSPEAHGVSGYTKKDGTNVRSHRRGGRRD